MARFRSGRAQMIDARKLYEIDGPFAFWRGGELSAVTLAYETWGALNPARDNAVLVFTGLSPSAHAAASSADPSRGWWGDMIGAGAPIDTNEFFVICVNSLGSCFGSTGPASVNPATGEPYRLDFPELALEDSAAAGARLLDHLGIDRLKCVVGPSMGGMTALAFCLMFPARSTALVSISSAFSADPFAIALRSLQREIVRADPLWIHGDYSSDAAPATGMRLARKLGMISYRSAAEWRKRFGRTRKVSGEHAQFTIEFEIESYLEAHSQKWIGSFDPNCYLYLSRAMDWFDAADHGPGIDAAMTRIALERALVVGVESDILFPPQRQRELALRLHAVGCGVDYNELASIQGHDSFLVDFDRFGPLMREFFEGLAGDVA
jgi:homoserine O-acetyltransferase